MMGFRLDGWRNLLAGLGRKYSDPKASTFYGLRDMIPRDELTAIYRQDGIGARIIDVPVDEMMRKGVVVRGDTNGGFELARRGLSLYSRISEAFKWKRLYGGSVIVAVTSDGSQGELQRPLNIKTIKKVESLRVYDRYDVDRVSYLDRNPNSPRYGMPEYYSVFADEMGNGGYPIHWTRCYELINGPIPNSSKVENQGWGDSSLEKVYSRLRGIGTAYSCSENVINEFITKILSFAGLQEALASNNESLVIKRADLMDQTMSLINTIFLDENETFDKVTANMSGFTDIVEKLEMALCSASGIPYRKLFGQQSGGLNNEGKGESDDWYDHIDSKRELELAPLLEWLLPILMHAKDGPWGGVPIKDWTLEFPPLQQMSAKEQAAVRELQAKVDQLYWSMDVVSSRDIQQSRFGGDEYSTETHITETADPGWREPEPPAGSDNVAE